MLSLTKLSSSKIFGLFPFARPRNFLSFRSYQRFLPDSIRNNGIQILPRNSDLKKAFLRTSIFCFAWFWRLSPVISIFVINSDVQNWMNVPDGHLQQPLPRRIDGFVLGLSPPHAVVQLEHCKRITLAAQVCGAQPLGTEHLHFQNTNVEKVGRKYGRSPKLRDNSGSSQQSRIVLSKSTIDLSCLPFRKLLSAFYTVFHFPLEMEIESYFAVIILGFSNEKLEVLKNLFNSFWWQNFYCLL